MNERFEREYREWSRRIQIAKLFGDHRAETYATMRQSQLLNAQLIGMSMMLSGKGVPV